MPGKDQAQELPVAVADMTGGFSLQGKLKVRLELSQHTLYVEGNVRTRWRTVEFLSMIQG